MKFIILFHVNMNTGVKCLPKGSPSTAKNSKLSNILCRGLTETNQLHVLEAKPLPGPS